MNPEQKPLDLGGILGDNSKPPVTYRKFDDTDAIRTSIFDNVLSAVSKKYPLENSRYTLGVENLSYKKQKPFSLVEQKNAIMGGESLEHKLHGDWVLKDKVSGAEVDRKPGVIAHIPWMTHRGTFIYKGNEYTVSNQMRLKPGIFTRVKDNGQIEAHVNVKPGTGMSFRMYMEPETGIFRLNVGQSNLKLYPILKAMGASDKDIEAHWGKELLQKNIEAEDPRAVSRAFARLVSTRADQAVGGEDNEAVQKVAAVSLDGPDNSTIKPDAIELSKGVKVEKEHTPIKKLDVEIAKDHLAEDPHYYSKLEKMEESKKATAEFDAVSRLIKDLNIFSPRRLASKELRKIVKDVVIEPEKEPSLTPSTKQVNSLLATKTAGAETARTIGMIGEDLATYLSRYIKPKDKKPQLLPKTENAQEQLPAQFKKVAAPPTAIQLEQLDILKDLQAKNIDLDTERRIQSEAGKGKMNTLANVGIGLGGAGTAGAVAGNYMLGRWLNTAQDTLNKYRFEGVSAPTENFKRVKETTNPSDFVHAYATHGSSMMDQAKMIDPSGKVYTGPEIMQGIYKAPGFKTITRSVIHEGAKTDWTPEKAKHYEAFKQGPLPAYERMLHEVLEEPYLSRYDRSYNPLRGLLGLNNPNEGYFALRADALKAANSSGVFDAEFNKSLPLFRKVAHNNLAKYGLESAEQVEAWAKEKALAHAFNARKLKANEHIGKALFDNRDKFFDLKEFLPPADNIRHEADNIHSFINGIEGHLEKSLGREGYNDFQHKLLTNPEEAYKLYHKHLGRPELVKDMTAEQTSSAVNRMLKQKLVSPEEAKALYAAIKTNSLKSLPSELQSKVLREIVSDPHPVNKLLMQRLDNGWRNRIEGYMGASKLVSSLEDAQKHINKKTIPFLRKWPGRVAIGGGLSVLGGAAIMKAMDRARRKKLEEQIRRQGERLKARL